MVTADDALALSCLAARSTATIETVPWDARPDWGRYAAVFIRSTWDYHQRLDAFLNWVDTVERAGPALWNPAAVVRWNADKRYLRQLEEAEVPIVPTEWIAKGSRYDLGEVLNRRGWIDAVAKPSVAATAYRTVRLARDGTEDAASPLGHILQDADALIQPFLAEVCSDGEWSFVYFDDGSGSLSFSHAVTKRARAGDFRVQSQFGGTARVADPPRNLLHQADRAADAVARLAPGPILYARIDGVVSSGTHAPRGTFLLMEAELIEPVLFLAQASHGAGRFAEAVARKIAILATDAA